jgi:hypothetical protein
MILGLISEEEEEKELSLFDLVYDLQDFQVMSLQDDIQNRALES